MARRSASALLEQNLARFGQHPLLPTPGQAAAGIPFRQVADYLSYPGQIPDASFCRFA